ncbi:MAG: hypothetical protein IPO41_16380 [Acidobacteria bacterium]|nr:hypothetical protein [Acidobacteriota bacterium]
MNLKNTIVLALFCFSLAITASAQSTDAKIKAGMARFPGIERSDMEQLIAAKQVMSVALPKWLPAGFKLEGIKSRLGRAVAIEDREFIIIYSRKLTSGKTQRFALEAGFDGLGDLMYDGAKILSTPVGKIHLLYEPKDADQNGKKLKNYVMTEWFNVGKTAFHYIGWYGGEEDDPDLAMISLADTEKILRSLQKL